MAFFSYGEIELAHLKRRDKKLGAATDRLGIIQRKVTPDPFSALTMNVVAQQISAKAADTVWARLEALLGGVTPAGICAASLESIQQCGLSFRKAGYIKGIGEAAEQGVLDCSTLAAMSDAEVVAALSALPGIGVWTAEMVLIFSLCRPNVLSWGDLAIRRGMMVLYGYKTLTRERFELLRKRYTPYGSVASLYLWELSHE